MTTNHRAEADEWLDEHLALDPESASLARSRALSRAQFHLLAAIHDEQRWHSGLLTDLREKIGDLAEALRPKPLISSDLTATQDQVNAHVAGPSWPAEHSCDCGRALPCRHCEADDAFERGVQWQQERDKSAHDPEPESVTVTLPRDVVKGADWNWRNVAYCLRAENHIAPANLCDALADALDAETTPPEATSAHESAPQPSEAPADGEDAERPTAANLGRIGWLSAPGWPPRLAREIAGGWTYLRTDDGPVWGSQYTYLVFTPLTPADFGWTVLGEGQVAVDREDLEWMRPRERHHSEADDFRHVDAALDALAPLIRAREAEAWDAGFTRGFYDVLAGGEHDASESAATNPYDRQEADDARD